MQLAPKLKVALHRLRALPFINQPLTRTVRGAARLRGVVPEFAVKHLPHSGVTTMSLPQGRRARLWSRGDDWVSNQVFWRGWDGYEPEVTPLFWQLAAQARVTLDVGAHVGFYTVLAATANPNGTVFAFEPLPPVFERLKHNLHLNAVNNAVALQQAAGAIDGDADFFHLPGVIPCSSSLSARFMEGTLRVEKLTVTVGRIDSFAKSHGVTRVDLLKLDTETTEPDVLAGMGDLLRASRPDIICEVLPSADAEALTDLLKPLDYMFYLLTDTGRERRDSVVPDGRWYNYLFTARVDRARQ